jgi:hypothetical protein
MRVNESGHRALRRDGDELDNLVGERPRVSGLQRSRSAKPASEAAARRGPKSLFDDPHASPSDAVVDDGTDDAPATAPTIPPQPEHPNARMLARFSADPRADEPDSFAPFAPFAPFIPSTPVQAPAAFDSEPNFGGGIESRWGNRLDTRSVNGRSFESDSDNNREVDAAAIRTLAASVTQDVNVPVAGAGVLATATATTVATTAAPRTDASALTSPPPGASAPAASAPNERPVEVTWLQTREAALVALRADYQAALALAQSDVPVFGDVGSGWVAANVAINQDTGQIYSPTNAQLVQVSDPDAAPVQVGWDEGGPVNQAPAGVWLEFNEAVFAESFRAQLATQPTAALQTLATAYATSAAAVFTEQPGLWEVATSDHALNAGPAPTGVAMGNAAQLGMTDLYLADPQIAALISAYGGTPEPATSPMALEQVRLYGQNRYNQLTRLGNAM